MRARPAVTHGAQLCGEAQRAKASKADWAGLVAFRLRRNWGMESVPERLNDSGDLRCPPSSVSGGSEQSANGTGRNESDFDDDARRSRRLASPKGSLYEPVIVFSDIRLTRRRTGKAAASASTLRPPPPRLREEGLPRLLLSTFEVGARSLSSVIDDARGVSISIENQATHEKVQTQVSKYLPVAQRGCGGRGTQPIHSSTWNGGA